MELHGAARSAEFSNEGPEGREGGAVAEGKSLAVILESGQCLVRRAEWQY